MTVTPSRLPWGFQPAAWSAVIAVLASGVTAAVVLTHSHHGHTAVLGDKYTAVGQGSTLASGASVNGNGQGNGNGNNKPGPTPGHPITVSGAISGQLSPGVTQTLRVTVSNDNNQDIRLTDVTVAAGTPIRGTTSVPGCDTQWLTIGSYHANKATGQLIVKHSSGYVDLAVSLLNRPTNQDDCKNVNFPLTYTATAVQA